MKYVTIFTILMTITMNLSKEVKVPVLHVSKKELAIARQILKNNPKVDKKLASKLSAFIHKYALVYKADPFRAVAVAMQESGYKNAVNKNTNKTRDLGVFQINTKTAKDYKFDTYRLVSDPEYAVKAYFTVMSDKTRMCSKLKKDAWTCYHSKNPVFRKQYKKLVNRYYAIN